MSVDPGELEATALALVAVEDCGGVATDALATLDDAAADPDLDPDERRTVERAAQIIRERSAR